MVWNERKHVLQKSVLATECFCIQRPFKKNVVPAIAEKRKYTVKHRRLKPPHPTFGLDLGIHFLWK